MREAARHVRSGAGPYLVEALTYRHCGHSKSDANRYRTREEIDAWKAKCPIRCFRDRLLEEGTLTAEKVEQIEAEACAAIDAAVAFAEASPEPSVETIEEGVYA